MPGKFSNIQEPQEKKSAFLELVTKPIGPTRQKALETIMRTRNMSLEQAIKFQAMKIIGVDSQEELDALPKAQGIGKF